jgi:hypothetical protein
MTDGTHREYGPYGFTGDRVGSSAIYFLDSHFADGGLSTGTDDDPLRWNTADTSTFDLLQNLDTGIKFIDLDPELDGSEIADLHRQFARLHAALPFSEPEREWLWVRAVNQGEVGIPGVLLGETAEVMSKGTLQVLQGRDLVRRWWAWRREAHEFEAQGSLNEACLALGGIAETLVLEQNRPPEWTRVRARLEQLRSDGV